MLLSVFGGSGSSNTPLLLLLAGRAPTSLFLAPGAGTDAGRYGPLLTVYGFRFDEAGRGGAYGFEKYGRGGCCIGGGGKVVCDEGSLVDPDNEDLGAVCPTT